jgi:hypothetical protein
MSRRSATSQGCGVITEAGVDFSDRIKKNYSVTDKFGSIHIACSSHNEASSCTSTQVLNAEMWGCPDLTDSALGVKTQRSPHENTVIEASSQQGELHGRVQTTGARVMASQWS